MADERPVVLVDGSNVIHSGAWIDHAGDDLHVRGKRFVDACASWSGGSGVVVVVVFDGTGPFQTAGEQRVSPTCTVIATVGNTADSWIEREAAIFRANGRSYRVVSNDVDLKVTAGVGPGSATASEAFVREVLDAGFGEGGHVPEGSDDPGPQGLLRFVDDMTREQLERMRHGDS